MTRPKRPHRRFASGVDDSGGHAALFQADGTRIGSPDQPFVGVAAVTVATEVLPAFEAAWNRLRAGIQKELGLEAPPPIHVRWMWGTNRPDKKKNPYVNATNAQVAAWLSTAVKILVQFTSRRRQFGITTVVLQRSHLQDQLSRYYADPEFDLELAYLRSRHVPRNLFKIYHRASTYPLLRVLQLAFWQLDESLKDVGGTSTSVTIDAFIGTDTIEAPEVIRSIQEFADLSRIDKLTVVDSYADSVLIQAADLVAWTINRLATQGLKEEVDQPFLQVFGPLIDNSRSLGGRRITKAPLMPRSSGASTLCIAYSLARGAAAAVDADFVDEVMVNVETFHARALKAFENMEAGKREYFGVSILTEEGQRRAEALAAPEMTGPRSKTAAE